MNVSHMPTVKILADKFIKYIFLQRCQRLREETFEKKVTQN